ncbi:MAG: HEAT repeat domain-containing protein [Candidatus Hydrogenedentes bacterium]|nr:HEAT repeat domain-containing protein [Candidatus Hydrogenedentota bacterium]
MIRVINQKNSRAGWAMVAALVAVVAGMPALAQDTPSLPDALQQIRTYEFGQNREMLSVVQDYCTKSYGDAAMRQQIEQGLIEILGSDATYDCKDFVCRQLYVIGTDASVPALAKMLTDEKHSDMARYALESIEGEAADDALLTALGNADDRVQVGIINSIGMRGQEEAVADLATLLNDPDPAVAKASATALGRIGGEKAADALAKARGSASEELKPAITNGYLMCASNYVQNGQKGKAKAIYAELNSDAESREAHIAAIEGLVAVEGADSLPMLIELLKGSDAGLQAIAAGALRNLEGGKVTAELASALPKLDPHGQLVALYALRAREDGEALPAVTAALDSSDPDVKIAALEALATVGNASSVSQLAALSMSDDAEVARVSRATLGALRGDDVDGVIVTAMQSADSPAKTVLIQALATRGAESAIPTLLQTASDQDESVRNASFDALGALANGSDLAALVDLLVKVNGDPSQTAAENAVVSTVQRIDPPQKGAQQIAQAFSTIKGKPEVRASLVRVVGRIADPSSLPQLRDLVASAKADPVKDAAVKALADWPTADALDDLRQIASNSDNNTHKTLAFRGFLRLLRQGGDRPVEETLALYEEASKLAASADDKRLVLAGLAEIGDERALALVEPYLADEEVKAEAAQATEQIKSKIQG